MLSKGRRGFNYLRAYGFERKKMKIEKTVKLDTKRRETFVGTKEVRLAPMEYKILVYFARHSSRVIDRPELYKHIYGVDGLTVTRSLDQHVARLRRKLGFRAIETVPTVGYKVARGAVVLA